MSKSLAETFPTLTLTPAEENIFGDVVIDRVSRTKRWTFLHIYMTSSHLIDRTAINRLEKTIKKQICVSSDTAVRIYEHFDLSDQYTPEYLMEHYLESLLEELRLYHPILHVLVRNGEFSYPSEREVVLTLEESVVAEDHAEELTRILEKVFNDRCGFDVQVSIAYMPRREKRSRTVRRALPENRQPVLTVRSAGEEAAQALPSDGFFGNEPEDDREPEDFSDLDYYQDEEPEEEDMMNRPPEVPPQSTAQDNRYRKNSRPGAKLSRSDNPDVLMGRDFDQETTQILDLEGEGGEVCLRGQILSSDPKKSGDFVVRELKNGKKLIMFDLTDFTETIKCKLFLTASQWEEELAPKLKIGQFIKLKGVPVMDSFDHELTIQSVNAMKIAPDFRQIRRDNAEEKRVELHCHTKMSELDGVTEGEDMLRRAYDWGMPGIAITDHGVVQGLTGKKGAYTAWKKIFEGVNKKRKEAGEEPVDRQEFFKLVPGVEAYLVDDLKRTVENGKGQALEGATYVVFDLETTGFSPAKDRIIEIGAVKIRNGEITDKFSEFVNPERPIPPRIVEVTHINDIMVKDAETIDAILPRFHEFIGDAILVGHNVAFDVGFITQNCREQGLPADYTSIDTMGLSRHYFATLARHTLDAVAKTLNVPLEGHHRAVNDAACTAEIFLRFLKDYIEKDGIRDMTALEKGTEMDPAAIRSLHPHHAVILAKNTVGRVNLYRLISKSHLDHLKRHPLIPKSELEQYREGLILGSACCAGELYEALVEGRSDEEIVRLVKYYDYLEIQPIANNRFMIADEKRYPDITCEDDIRELNRQILRLGKQYGKPVVATGDAHFLDPEDEIYRTIVLSGKEMDAEEAAPLYLHTTEEMLAEFDYLDPETAHRIVIENPRRIFDMCDSISAVRPDKCVPVIENSDETLRRICYDKAHEVYGEELPEVVKERLERELHSIISNGFAVMYIIAQKLVWKSMEDGYMVGSRGSVGSSFVAYMAGISEVNSLRPHYICPKCHYTDFDSDLVKSYAGNSGCDMPDRDCPVCGGKLNKDGFDIPFETFLGFKGDKEPDIDLNFSSEYQSKAHKYTEVIFGNGQTFRAGTISGLADKNAYGYVKKYYERLQIPKRSGEINRQLTHLVGIKTNTGQHPGGIIVLPKGEEIDTFTPVQRPANKEEAESITTHFDYHSIEHNLLKLDILGHDDPTMIRYLHDLTGIDPLGVPLDDPEVMELFISTKSLGIRPDDIGGTQLGCLGLPEFGTDFAMNMVIEAKPKTFSHLIRISGLSHGTNVWSGNAQDLIRDGIATIDTAICTRDDIMLYLIKQGLEEAAAFKIMEQVRKGKGLSGEQQEMMRNAGVPEWYIESCLKIQYMFPKAHAAAYVTMCWRIAWFKVHRPQDYYAAWFSIRSKHFDYEHICRGAAVLAEHMAEYKRLEAEKKLSTAQKNEMYDMRMAQEMYARGIEFLPLDLYRAKARHFTVIEDKIMPSINCVNGMGDTAARAIEEAAKAGPFLSVEDFRNRSKCPGPSAEVLKKLGILGDIPESNQMSIFDLMKN